MTFNANGKQIIYCSQLVLQIWKADSQELVFPSEGPVTYLPRLSHCGALSVLRDCGSASSYVWPKSMERPSCEVFLENQYVCYLERNITDHPNLSKKECLAYLPCFRDRRWEFSSSEGILVTVTKDRALSICRLDKKGAGSSRQTG